MFSRLGALRGISTGYREEESLDHHRISHDKPIARVPNLAITILSLKFRSDTVSQPLFSPRTLLMKLAPKPVATTQNMTGSNSPVTLNKTRIGGHPPEKKIIGKQTGQARHARINCPTKTAYTPSNQYNIIYINYSILG